MGTPETTPPYDYPRAIVALVEVLLEEGRLDAACELATHLASKFPSRTRAHVLVARIERLRGNVDEAVAAVERAMELDPADAQAHVELRECQRGDARVTMLLRRAHDAARDNDEITNALVEAYAGCGEVAEALRLARDCAAAHPVRPRAVLRLTKLTATIGMMDVAGKLLSSFLALGPVDTSIVPEFVTCLCLMGKTKEALETLSQAMKVAPSPALTARAAELLDEVGQGETATELLDHGISEWNDVALRTTWQKRAWRSAHARHDRLVVFVVSAVTGRAHRIARALRAQGWRVGVLYATDSGTTLGNTFDFAQQYTGVADALVRGRKLSPCAFHVFNWIGDQFTSDFIDGRPGPVVFDTYDVVEGMFSDFDGPRCDRQRASLEGADALTVRDLRVWYLLAKLGYKPPKTAIFFGDYCDEPVRCAEPRVLGPRDEIHICSAGYIATGVGSDERDWGYLEVAERLSAQNIHFHIYPHAEQTTHPGFRRDFAPFLELASRSRHVRVHDTLPADALRRELSQYHAGYNAVWSQVVGQPMGRHYTDQHFAYCGSLRNIEYLEAGLVTLLPQGSRYQYWLLNRHAVAHEVTLEFLDRAEPELRAILSSQTRSSDFRKARNAMAMSGQIGRLIQLYENLNKS